MNLDISTILSSAQIAFGISVIAFLLGLYVLGIFRKPTNKNHKK